MFEIDVKVDMKIAPISLYPAPFPGACCELTHQIDMGPNKFHGCILKVSLEFCTLSISFTLVDSNLKERKVTTDFRRT